MLFLCRPTCKLFSIFDATWVFEDCFGQNVQQILVGSLFKKKLLLIWANFSKTMLAQIWFQRNQRTFHDKETSLLDCFETASTNTAAWCTPIKILKLSSFKLSVTTGRLSFIQLLNSHSFMKTLCFDFLYGCCPLMYLKCFYFDSILNLQIIAVCTLEYSILYLWTLCLLDMMRVLGGVIRVEMSGCTY